MSEFGWREIIEDFQSTVNDQFQPDTIKEKPDGVVIKCTSILESVCKGIFKEYNPHFSIPEDFPVKIMAMKIFAPELFSDSTIERLVNGNRRRNEAVHENKTPPFDKAIDYLDITLEVLNGLLEINDFSQIDLKWSCPQCESKNDPLDNFCKSCGFNYQQYVIDEQKKNKEEQEEKRRIEEGLELCPACKKHENLIGSTFCGGCGENISETKLIKGKADLRNRTSSISYEITQSYDLGKSALGLQIVLYIVNAVYEILPMLFLCNGVLIGLVLQIMSLYRALRGAYKGFTSINALFGKEINELPGIIGRDRLRIRAKAIGALALNGIVLYFAFKGFLLVWENRSEIFWMFS